jgi:hypothetical protein
MPFHDARKGQSEKHDHNQAPLFSEESSANAAKSRARSFLAEVLPWEFGQYAGQNEKVTAQWMNGMGKISKSSS